jgi:SnoaL-like domain
VRRSLQDQPCTPPLHKQPVELAPLAREAIVNVCSGKRLAAAGDYYSPDFVDHVNAMTFHGLEGVRRSVALYRELFPDLRSTNVRCATRVGYPPLTTRRANR